MADTIFTRALAQAVETMGSAQALASALRVPENTMQRWVSGRAQMPLQAFHRTIEILTEHERRDAAPAAAGPAALTERVAFTLDGVSAHCEKCGGMEFLSGAPRHALRMTSRLECFSCRASMIHGELIGALATLAIRHSRKPPRRPAREAAAGPRVRSRDPDRA